MQDYTNCVITVINDKYIDNSYAVPRFVSIGTKVFFVNYLGKCIYWILPLQEDYRDLSSYVAQASSLAQLAHHASSWPPRNELSSSIFDLSRRL